MVIQEIYKDLCRKALEKMELSSFLPPPNLLDAATKLVKGLGQEDAKYGLFGYSSSHLSVFHHDVSIETKQARLFRKILLMYATAHQKIEALSILQNKHCKIRNESIDFLQALSQCAGLIKEQKIGQCFDLSLLAMYFLVEEAKTFLLTAKEYILNNPDITVAEQAEIIEYLRIKGISIELYSGLNTFDHAFLVIGRDQYKNVNKLTDFLPDTLIFDPWLRCMFPVKHAYAYWGDIAEALNWCELTHILSAERNLEKQQFIPWHERALLATAEIEGVYEINIGFHHVLSLNEQFLP
jgi:hypothetical protein